MPLLRQTGRQTDARACARTHNDDDNNNNNNNNNNNKRQYQPPYPRNKHPYNTPDRGPNGNSQGIGAINCCRKDLHTRGYRDPRTTSFLYNCKLTKNCLATISLLKHFSTC